MPQPARRPTLARALLFACLALVAALLGVGCGGALRMDALSSAQGEDLQGYEAARLRLLDDYQPWLGPAEIRLGRGSAQVLVPAEFGWCYAYFATGGAGIQDLDLVVTRPNGREVGRDTMFDATPYAQHCSDHDEEVRVDIVVVRGAGSASLGVLRKPD